MFIKYVIIKYVIIKYVIIKYVIIKYVKIFLSRSILTNICHLLQIVMCTLSTVRSLQYKIVQYLLQGSYNT